MSDTAKVTESDATADSPDLASVIHSIARALKLSSNPKDRAGKAPLPKHDLVSLRKLNPRALSQPAFWRILQELVPDEFRKTEEQETRWAIILRAMARMPGGGHDPNVSIGAALAACEFSELRLCKLLRTSEEALPEVIRRMTHLLVSKGQNLDWIELGTYILMKDSEKRELAHRRIAKSYYRHSHKNESK